MNNLRQDTSDGAGSRANTTTEQDFRYISLQRLVALTDSQLLAKIENLLLLPLRTSANRYSNDSASLARSDPFYRDTSVNIATSGAREFSPEKRESYSSYDYSPKESGYGSSSVNLR